MTCREKKNKPQKQYYWNISEVIAVDKSLLFPPKCNHCLSHQPRDRPKGPDNADNCIQIKGQSEPICPSGFGPMSQNFIFISCNASY